MGSGAAVSATGTLPRLAYARCCVRSTARRIPDRRVLTSDMLSNAFFAALAQQIDDMPE
jgi:hypothetical protein